MLSPIPKGETKLMSHLRCIKHGHTVTRFLFFNVLFGSGHLFQLAVHEVSLCRYLCFCGVCVQCLALLGLSAVPVESEGVVL